MQSLSTMPQPSTGVVGKPKRIFVTSEDVMKLFGCKKSCAGKMIQETNEDAKKRGEHAFPSGKANKYTFSKFFGIPLSDIENVMVEEWEQ